MDYNKAVEVALLGAIKQRDEALAQYDRLIGIIVKRCLGREGENGNIILAKTGVWDGELPTTDRPDNNGGAQAVPDEPIRGEVEPTQPTEGVEVAQTGKGNRARTKPRTNNGKASRPKLQKRRSGKPRSK